MRKLSGILYGIILSALDDTISNKHIKKLISSIMTKTRSKSLELYASLYALSSLQECRFYNEINCPPIIGQEIFASFGK